jgi:CRISPR-associated protein Cas2
MIVIITENIEPFLRGRLSVYLLEVRAGVYVGNLSASERVMICETIKNNLMGGNVIIIYKTNNEMGYNFIDYGENRRMPIKLDGVKFISFYPFGDDI